LSALSRLYGTTSIGGAVGVGTVFQLTLAGVETILHDFAGAPSDGQEPDSSLTHDAAGNLYGTAAIGGSGDCPPGLGVGCGTIFKVVP
jgi:uncharacterized repeat protein (TIGR03803 family)